MSNSGRIERLPSFVELGGDWLPRLVLVPELGGMIRQIEFIREGRPFPVLHDDSDEELVANPWFRGRFLFPFNDRIPDGKYTWDDVQYQLEINEERDAIHGFLYRQSMERISSSKSPSAQWIRLFYQTDGTHPGYPFLLKLVITYQVSPDRVDIQVDIKNTGKTSAPLTFGWHPYFSLPGTKKIDDVILTIPASKYAETDARFCATGVLRSVENTRYDFRKGRNLGEYDYDMFLACPSGWASLETPFCMLRIEFNGELLKGFQLFVPPDRTSVALEPVTAPANTFNHPELGLIALGPGKSISSQIHLAMYFKET
ncbi:aldose 1-epimerase [Spirochaetia bacterium 38H-sp]|uniref:Aldose 1-epimerase n=1 Tax=Rarispira pelagica TaxID=3141764 RepID=A0ABU9U8Y3_9SPIR